MSECYKCGEVATEASAKSAYPICEDCESGSNCFTCEFCGSGLASNKADLGDGRIEWWCSDCVESNRALNELEASVKRHPSVTGKIPHLCDYCWHFAGLKSVASMFSEERQKWCCAECDEELTEMEGKK